MKIEACFDSHVHWAETGEFANRLRVDQLTAPEEILSIRPEPFHHRGEWVVGFGWDENKWSHPPTRESLDQWFPTQPVALSRCDAHALWVNTLALQMAGLWNQNQPSPLGGRVVLDNEGWPTGVLLDTARASVQALLPPPSPIEIRRYLLQGVATFNAAGFTHIRDMTCNPQQWTEAMKLDRSGLLTLAVEEYFDVRDLNQLDSILKFVLAAKEEPTQHLRIKGIKVFLDGALGSEGAWLSTCYCGKLDYGLKLWELPALREVMMRVWDAGLDLAVHVIGDEAGAVLIDLALELKRDGKYGRLHLEHAELLRPETIVKMKELQVECHMQPCHWLTDQLWLKNKIGELVEFAFPWRKLQEQEIAFDFGSDSPIEPPNISRTLEALRLSADQGIPRLLGSPINYMSHRDLAWAPNSFTMFEEEIPRQVVFCGEHIL